MQSSNPLVALVNIAFGENDTLAAFKRIMGVLVTAAIGYRLVEGLPLVGKDSWPSS